VRPLYPWLAALVVAAGLTSGAFADPWPFAAPCAPLPQAPDACGRGYYNTNRCGDVFGPNYNVYPPFHPYQGPACGQPNFSQQPRFVTHSHARSPRDFFMMDP
jgi:hypothetical protein